MLNSRQAIPTALVSTVPDEKQQNVLFCVMKAIASDSQNNLRDLIIHLLRYPYSLLASFAEKNPDFQKFCHTNEIFIKRMKEKLAHADQPHLEVSAITGKEFHSVFDLYIAALVMEDFKNSRLFKANNDHRTFTLNFACDLGSNNALLTRVRINERIFANPEKPASQKAMALQRILEDLDRVADLYWGVGYTQAAAILHNMGSTLLKKESAEEKNQGQELLDQSNVKLICAVLLAKEKYSEEVLQSITLGKGVAEILSTADIDFKSWDELKDTLIKRIGHERYNELEIQATRELEEKFRACHKANIKI